MANTQLDPEPSPKARKELTLNDLADKIDKLAKKVETSDQRFGNYQQATQWVEYLAFWLIASATLTVIITSVLRR